MDTEKNSDCLQLFMVDGDKYRTRLSKKYNLRKPYQPADPKKIVAFIPGTIKKVFVQEGKKIKKGDQLFILEAMKMNNTMFAPIDGAIKKLHVKTGQIVSKNQILVEFE